VLLADRAPWRGARQLIALGLAGDRYPVAPAVSPLFLDSELDEIARACGISMTRRADRLAERMDLMRRQISVARDGVTALVPRRGLDGRPQAPAPLATLLARALGAADAESALSDPGPAAAAWDVAAVPVSQAPPRPAVPADGRIALGRDLAILRTREDGRPRPQSPSRLETLLVSPLAWLLAEIEALDVTWVAEEPTALARGSVAHGVFERLFAPGAPPGSAAIAAGFDAALAEAIAEEAPFYERADWSVDRGHLAAETRRAAEAWAARLAAMGAEIVEVETRLEGPAHGLALSGKADAILRLADGRMLVVDYKSGRSDRRRTRMQAGWDLQVRLYLDLLGTAGRGADGVGYFCLGDGVLLSSSPVTGADRVSGDISGAALERIAERLGEVRRGIVTLNAEGDAKALSKLGIGAYALDSSPLVAAHLTMEDGA
jgi:RecB family exonuclease